MRGRARRGRGNEDAFVAPQTPSPSLWTRHGALRPGRRHQENVRATVVVVGHHATWVEKELSAGASPLRPLTFVEQREQLGTGHAVSVALATIDEAIGNTDGDVVILPGDTPLLRGPASRVCSRFTVNVRPPSPC